MKIGPDVLRIIKKSGKVWKSKQGQPKSQRIQQSIPASLTKRKVLGAHQGLDHVLRIKLKRVLFSLTLIL